MKDKELEKSLIIAFGQMMIQEAEYPNVGELVKKAMKLDSAVIKNGIIYRNVDISQELSDD